MLEFLESQGPCACRGDFFFHLQQACSLCPGINFFLKGKGLEKIQRLACGVVGYHSMTELAKVSPPPKTTSRMGSPF